MGKNILVVAPHPDDESIGCGGVICLHRERGDRVAVAVLTSGERALSHLPALVARSIREAEVEQAGELLGVTQIDFLRLPDLGLLRSVDRAAQQLSEILRARMPDMIYLPHPEESHIDHMAANPIVRSSLAHLRSSYGSPVLRGYEVWTPLTWYSHVEDITPVMKQKLRAIRRHQSQIRLYRHDSAARGLARYRGVMTNQGEYAEVFCDLAPRAASEHMRKSILYWTMPSRFLRLRRAASLLRRRWRNRAPRPGTAAVRISDQLARGGKSH